MNVDTFSPLGEWSKIQAAAVRAEALGFTNFCAPEITGDPFIKLAVAALATQSIGLRTAIAVAFPRSPMVVAGTSWALHVNSKGRFTLGLGTQVKAHNQRRFSVAWSKPRSRLREYVESLRAIWRCWEHPGESLNYAGTFYQFSLMTPEFSPPPSKLPMIPVYLAAVRPAMLSLAGEVADGVRLHGFCTRRYQQEVVMPALAEGMKKSGRHRREFEVCGGGFVATGEDDEAVQKSREFIRYRVAFYGSTPAYAPVMELHGWHDLAAKLHRLSRVGKWSEMAAQVPDSVLDEFAVSARFCDLADAVQARFGGLSDTIEIGFPGNDSGDDLQAVLQDIRKLPQAFSPRVPRLEQPPIA